MSVITDSAPRAPSPTYSVNTSTDGSSSVQSLNQQNFQSNNDDYIFRCSMDSTESLRALLSALELEKTSAKANQAFNQSIGQSIDQSAPLLVRCRVLAAGLKFSARRSRILSARAYFKSNLCREWDLRKDEFGFTVSLYRLTQTLSMFSPMARLTIQAKADGEEIEMQLEEAGVVAQCTLACVSSDGDDENALEDAAVEAFRAEPTVARAVVDSTMLHACLSDLDIAGCEAIAMVWQRDFPRLRFAGFTSLFSVMTGFAVRSGDPHGIDSLTELSIDDSVTDALCFVYPHALVRPSLNVANTAKHTNIRVNRIGILSMQHVIRTMQQDVNNWVEFIAIPLANPALDDGQD